MSISRILQFLSFRVIGRNSTRKALLKLFKVFDLDVLSVAHNQIGIDKYGDNIQTGEDYFIRKYLYDRFGNRDSIIIFDVGANVGQYSIRISELFPLADIYAFEPNPMTFKSLLKKTLHLKNIKTYCFGIGKEASTSNIYSYKTDPESEHASVLKSIITELHNSDMVVEYPIEIISLDSFCESKKISTIDFLKIDTEGYELEVLKGAAHLISNKGIEVIQFEFNEMNVFSRVFLNDFYSVLPNYKFYRLDTAKLIPLGSYNSVNEIFKYQNIIAIKN
jgi:FkbM family methyltransferase